MLNKLGMKQTKTSQSAIRMLHDMKILKYDPLGRKAFLPLIKKERNIRKETGLIVISFTQNKNGGCFCFSKYKKA